ncbi:MAG: NTP transferase domain-containing protein [Pseudomonadota bacterium]
MSSINPQIVIPMSGHGERFRRAGYKLPKPLIEVDGKPIIAHVLDMFPGASDVTFICNRVHLSNPDYAMEQTLRRHCPTAKIVPVTTHKKGPVDAVLRAQEHIDPKRPIIVNYCDFTCYWDYEEFKSFLEQTNCDGCVPAYKGFHPHSLGSTFYAYMKHDGLWMTDIQEKQPWTDTPTQEYASSGTYYFKSGQLCLQAFKAQIAADLKVNGEYYASLAYRILAQAGARTAIYDLQHFMQWGTPEDLEEYKGWSNAFRRLAEDDIERARQSGAVLVPMAGLGSRFSKAGYATPKPLLPVSGRAMVLQATRDLPDAPVTRFVLRKDLPALEEIVGKLKTSFVAAAPMILDKLTDGQAITCLEGLNGLDREAPLTIGACDNGMLYDKRKFETLLAEGGPDVLAWTIRGHSDGKRRPEQFGWAETDEDGRILSMRVKESPEDPATAPMIVGAFTFRRAADFEACVQALVNRDGRVNGEFYVDSLIEDAVAMGLDVQVFDIDHYIGWGTPDDLRTFQYWQSCFHKWRTHPYRLDKDKRVAPGNLERLKRAYAHISPPLPEGVEPAPTQETETGFLTRALRAVGAA